jgi:hypothetical protein
MVSMLLAITIAAVSTARNSDCARDELTGPVHTVVAMFQSLEPQANGSIDTAQTLAWSDAYDRSCNIVEHRQPVGPLIEVQHEQRIDATTVAITSTNGNKTRRERFDAAGNCVETWTSGTDGRFIDHTVYVYDDRGLVQRLDSFNEDGKPYGGSRFAYDGGGHLVRQDILFGDGRAMVETYTYEYDARGNWIKEVISSNDPDKGIREIRPSGIVFRTITFYAP